MAKRQLLLLRHAKAERAGPGESDHDRALSERGRSDAGQVGALIAERGLTPDRALVSTARRTRQTFALAADAMSEAMGGDTALVELDSLFEPGAGYLPIIRTEGGDAERLLVVGHNPYVHHAAVTLSSDRHSRHARALADHMPTAALAVLEFEGGWPDIAEGTMTLTGFFLPDRDR
jgi:phosphohistidine phosphatase